ncbi:Stk1 family PASTA domain-containing Ser/Thr kinase [Cellulomonas hominis]
MVDDGSRILAGRYEVGELIGRGGMAEVHIGHDTRLGRTVAIKILRSDLARDPSFQARFRREAQAAAALNHPAIVAVYDTGEDVVTEVTGVVAHVPFIVMEYVEGHTVRDILRDGHAVPIDEAIEITSGVLSALEYSHHAGIVHRDIKPANVMLTPTGAVKVMDFGIARAVADSAATMTQTQAVIGTAQYLSPEQARGETVDARSDLYSTGCLLFELLTGRPPFQGDSPVAVAYQHVREAAPTPSSFASDVPDTLDRITLKALAKERDSRYSTAAEFRSDLEAAARGGRVAAPPVGSIAATPLPAETTQVFGAQTATTQAVAPTPAWAPTGPGTSVLPAATTTAPPEEDEPRSRWLLWTLIGVAVLAIAGIIAVFALGGDDEKDPVVTVTVPAVANLPEADASQALTNATLVVVRREEASDLDAGLATRTDPAEGTSVESGSNVTLYVSSGPATVTVPDVTGLTQEQARAQLEEADLVVGAISTADVPDQARDRVVSTDPAANAPAAAGQTVAIVLASGNVPLPDLRGQTQETAQQTLSSLNLTGTFSNVESDEAPGTIISQDRSPGLVEQRTAVAFQVAIARTTVQIPSDIVGKPFADAAAQLGALNLEVAQVYATTPSSQAKDTVLSASPTVGTTVQLGSTVTLTLSPGPATTGGGGNGGGDGGSGG